MTVALSASWVTPVTRVTKAHVDVGKGFQPLDAHTRQLVLFGLDDKRIGSFAAQDFMVEFDNFLALRLVPELKIARHQTFRDELIDQANPRDHLQSRRMSRGGTGIVIDPGFRFEQTHGVTVLRARQRGNNPDRAGAGDDNAGLLHDQ